MIERGIGGAADHITAHRLEGPRADDVDDYPIPLLLHKWEHFTRHAHVTKELERPIFCPRIIRQRQEIAWTSTTGIVDQNIDATERVAAFGHDCCDSITLCDVGLHANDTAFALFPSEAYGLFKRLFPPGADQDRGALGKKAKRCGLANTFAAAGDDRNFSFESEFHNPSFADTCPAALRRCCYTGLNFANF